MIPAILPCFLCQDRHFAHEMTVCTLGAVREAHLCAECARCERVPF